MSTCADVLYRDGAQGEWAYWEKRLGQELWKPSAKGMAGVDCLIAELGLRRFCSAATYPQERQRRGERGIAPELVMVATSAVEREFRAINRHTELVQDGAMKVWRELPGFWRKSLMEQRCQLFDMLPSF